jgi:UDP-N-acetylmuramoyl-tripeptide--D-alanyl-D-alanine ligase
MPDLTISDLKKLTASRLLPVNGLRESGIIPGVSIDSRTVKAGQIFWALKGERFDGHDFLTTAFQKQISLAVIDSRYYHERFAGLGAFLLVPDTLMALQELARLYRERLQIPVIAVTGSNGKTTTKDMIAQILQTRYAAHKTTGNLNNHIGCPLTLLGIESQHQAAVVELGTNHPGELSVLVKMAQPDHAVITNIGGAHLEFFKTREGIAREKLAIFEGARANGCLYKNLDDPLIAAFRDGQRKVVTYSLKMPADVTGKLLNTDRFGNGSWRLNDKTSIQMRLPGVHLICNALAASAVALNLGFSEAEIKDALENYTATDKRMQVMERNGITIINDAYNANPVSMQAAFDSVAAMKTEGRLFLLLGDMLELGEISPEAHAKILQSASKVNPRFVILLGAQMQQAVTKLDAAKRGIFKPVTNHAAAAKELQNQIKPGDVLLLKGSRGMALEKVLDLMNSGKI